MDWFARLFHLRKQHDVDEKSASSSSTYLTKQPSGRRPWQRLKKYCDHCRKDASPSSSVKEKDLLVCHCLLNQREKNPPQLEQEPSETQNAPEQDHINVHHSASKNSLEQEFADEDHFDWNNLEQQALWSVPDFATSHVNLASSAFPASCTELVVDHDDLAFMASPVSQSVPPLRHKSPSQNLREQYLRDKPLPPTPNPVFAFPSPSILTSSRPNRWSPSDAPSASPIDQHTSVNLVRISDLLLDAAAELRRENRRRENRKRRLSRESATRPEMSVSPQSRSPELQFSIDNGTSSFGGSDSTTGHQSTYGLGSLDHTVSPTTNNRGSPRASVARKFARISSFARFAKASSTTDNGDPSIESIASEPEVMSPWAMFDACIKHDKMYEF